VKLIFKKSHFQAEVTLFIFISYKLKMRIRKEIRSLSSDEWNRVVRALWIMKSTSMEVGKRQYGKAFFTWDYFTYIHAFAAFNIHGIGIMFEILSIKYI
jgi:hypothetical protein